MKGGDEETKAFIRGKFLNGFRQDRGEFDHYGSSIHRQVDGETFKKYNPGSLTPVKITGRRVKSPAI